MHYAATAWLITSRPQVPVLPPRPHTKSSCAAPVGGRSGQPPLSAFVTKYTMSRQSAAEQAIRPAQLGAHPAPHRGKSRRHRQTAFESRSYARRGQLRREPIRRRPWKGHQGRSMGSPSRRSLACGRKVGVRHRTGRIARFVARTRNTASVPF
jgi:hypothetical protein